MRLELKICERCGALWFRPEFRNWIYCVGCFPIMEMMATPSLRTAKAGRQ
jgi:hypothetical protein